LSDRKKTPLTDVGGEVREGEKQIDRILRNPEARRPGIKCSKANLLGEDGHRKGGPSCHKYGPWQASSEGEDHGREGVAPERKRAWV